MPDPLPPELRRTPKRIQRNVTVRDRLLSAAAEAAQEAIG